MRATQWRHRLWLQNFTTFRHSSLRAAFITCPSLHLLTLNVLATDFATNLRPNREFLFLSAKLLTELMAVALSSVFSTLRAQ